MQACVHIVDDDASFLVAMERRLKHAGYTVATYASALQLLVNLPTESIPSCILLDVRIPGLDGPALQKRLAELTSWPYDPVASCDSMKGLRRSMGTGRMIVEFWLTAISPIV